MAELKSKTATGDYKGKKGKFTIYLKDDGKDTFKVTYLPEQTGWLREGEEVYKKDLNMEEAAKAYQELETLITL